MMTNLTPEQFAKMTKKPGIVIPAPHIAQEVADAYNKQYPDPLPNPHHRAQSILGNQVVGGEVLPKSKES